MEKRICKSGLFLIMAGYVLSSSVGFIKCQRYRIFGHAMLPANTPRMNGNVPVPVGISWVALFQVLYPPFPSEIWFNEMAFPLKFINHWTFRRWVSGKKPLILTIHQPGHISMQKGVIPLVHPRKINIALEKMIVAWKSTFLLAWAYHQGLCQLVKTFQGKYPFSHKHGGGKSP